MNRLKQFFVVLLYLLKAALLIVFHILKFLFTIIPFMFSEIYKQINIRLRFSITFKTTVTYMLIFTTILLCLGVAITGGFTYYLFRQTTQSLENNSQVIIGFINEGKDLPESKLANFAKIEGITITLLNQTGKVIYSNRPSSGISNLPRTELTDNTSFDMNNFYLHVPVNHHPTIHMLLISQSLSAEKYYLQTFVIGLGASFLIVIFIASIFGSLASRKMLRPIDNMTRTARSISAGDLNMRLDPVDSHDELKDLALTFNEMLDRIQRSFDQQNTFVSDASHELKTPISVIQGYSNMLQRWGSEDPAVLKESIEAIKSEADYMKELVEKLLFLASTDKKKQVLVREPFPLHELIDELVKESRLIDAKHQIGSEINDFITFNGDRALIKQALRIFIDNSIKFTPDGGSIVLNSINKGKKIVITVEDSGIGISAEDLPYVFNRFYKADKSRIRQGGGVGLGLSISKWIIDQHQGDIKVESFPRQGTKMIIHLPLS